MPVILYAAKSSLISYMLLGGFSTAWEHCCSLSEVERKKIQACAKLFLHLQKLGFHCENTIGINILSE